MESKLLSLSLGSCSSDSDPEASRIGVSTIALVIGALGGALDLLEAG